MEQLKVSEYSNVFIGCYFTDDMECSHPNAEHTLIYLLSGQLEITDCGKKNNPPSWRMCVYVSRQQNVPSKKSEGWYAISLHSAEIQP